MTSISLLAGTDACGGEVEFMAFAVGVALIELGPAGS
jgi:hypothetical protein